jgi:host factor-I protein
MQSFFERRGPRLDTSLPSVRHIQTLIRNRTVVSVQLSTGVMLEGHIRWQDNNFIALHQDEQRPLVLLNLNAIALLKALE